MIAKPMHVKAVGKYTIWLQYSDNTQGEVDLSYLIHKPIFAEWNNHEFFNNVRIDDETNAIAWSDTIELCPDSLYLKVKGITFDEWKTNNFSYATDK